MNNFLVFMAVLFALAALLRIDFFFSIVYLFVGIYIVLRFWAERMLRDLKVTRHFNNRAFINDSVSVTLKLENTSRLPIPWLLINEAIPWSLFTSSSLRQVIGLGSKDSFTLNYELKPRRRGYYQIGPLVLNAGDLLGLNRNLMGRLEADYLIVYPKIVALSQLGLPTHSPQVVLPTPIPIFEDPARINGVRDYHWGDNPRHIHWPATANAGQVAVKQFQPAIARDSTIFLNLTRQDYHRTEREHALELAIITAASLASHMLNNESLPVGLYTAALDPLTQKQQTFSLSPSKQASQLMQILEILARVKPVDQSDFLADIRREAVHLSWGATIIIITSQESDELLKTILWLKQSGFKPSLIIVGQHRQLKTATQLTVPTFEVWQEKDLETWQTIPL